MLLFKRNKKFIQGFTLVELLVVISIISIISGIFISYNRGSEKQFILFREQQKVVSALQKARDFSLSAYGGVDVPCGYGVHFENPNIIVIFKASPPDSGARCTALATISKIYNTSANDINQPCGDPVLNKECVEKIYLDKGIVFDGATDLDDIIFIPPEPAVYINNDDSAYQRMVVLKVEEGGATKTVKATKAGQVTAY